MHYDKEANDVAVDGTNPLIISDEPTAELLDAGTEADKGDVKHVQTDTGWAWVILLAAALEFFLVIGYMKCVGIFFVHWQQRFQSSAAATSLVIMLQNTVFSIGALVVMTVGMRYMSIRTSVMVGAAMIGISHLITAFANDIRVVYFSDGILNGVSVAFTHPPMVAMINVYFVKYRGLANNVANAGVSLGGLALAPLMTKLFDHYGYTGTFMIAAALLFNVAECGALLRPSSTHSNLVSVRSHSVVDLAHSRHSVEQPKGNVNNDSKRAASYSITYIRKVCRNTYNAASNTFVLGLFRNPVFLFYLTMTSVLCPGNVLVADFVAPRAKELGIDDNAIALLLSVECGSDLIAKFVFGYISDKDWVRASTLMALAAAGIGFASHLMSFLTTFPSIMAFTVVLGVLEGVYYALYVVVIVDYLSLDHLQPVLGYTALVQGMSTGALYPVVGILRDVTGSYVVSYHFVGFLLLLGAAMCLCLPPVQRWHDTRNTHKDNSPTRC